MKFFNYLGFSAVFGLLMINLSLADNIDDAFDALENQDYETAFKIAKKEADDGNSFGQLILGSMYLDGLGRAKDVTQAVAWYTLSADAGNAAAQHVLGTIYDTGIGVPENNEEAVKWYSLAAQQDDSDAQYALGTMYYFGEGVAKNLTQALKWYSLAAQQGNPDAQWYAGYMYNNAIGVNKNVGEAMKWYSLSANQGNADAQNNLGLIYKDTAKSEEDLDKAFNLFKSAAEIGNVEAMVSLGQMYRNSSEYRSCEPFSESWHEDDRKGAFWLYSAAMKNHSLAQALLGMYYVMGDIEGKPNYVKAYIWSAIAAQSGDDEGVYWQKTAKEELNQEELIDAENQLVRCLDSNIVDCPAFFTKPHSIVLPDKC